MFNNKRITNLENQIAELTARLVRLEAAREALGSAVEHLELRVEDKLDGVFDRLDEKIEAAVESYDFSDAAREALESVANDATFTINF